MNNFCGSFNKKHNHRDCEYLKNEYGIDYFFDEELFKKVERQIKTVLGDNSVYSVSEAFCFFQTVFSSYPIDIRQYYNYVDTSLIKAGQLDGYTISKNTDIETLADDCGFFYSYIGEKNQEQNLTFVIDIVGNIHLREQYPQIIETEQNKIKTMEYYGRVCNENGNWFLCTEKSKEYLAGIKQNIIIAIGSIDGIAINSMKILSGSGILPKIEYILEFFRRNS